VTVSEDGKVVIVERDDGRFVRLMRDVCSTLLDAAVSDDGEMIAVACDDLLVRVYRDDDVRHTLRSSRGAFQAIAFSPDRRRLVGGSQGGAIYIWDLETGERLHGIVDAGASIRTVGFDASGNRIIALDESGRVSVWDLDEQPIRRRAFDPGVDGLGDIAIDPDGHRLICVGSREIAVFDLATLERIGEPMDVIESDPRTPGMVTTSPDGGLIALGRADGRVRVVVGPTADAALLN
jgi:WD40 repeat protein